MSKWTVYTDAGDYTDIWAESADAACRKVWYLTHGLATNLRAVMS